MANYPGVTAERHTGTARLPSGDAQLVDLPGAYSLAAHSPDEMVAADVLLGRMNDMPRPAAVLIVVDSANLRRNLFMATQKLRMSIIFERVGELLGVRILQSGMRSSDHPSTELTMKEH